MRARPLPAKPFSVTLSKSSDCTTARDTSQLWWRTSELLTTSSWDSRQEESPAAVAGLDGLSSWDGTDSRHGAACQLPERTWKLWGKGEFEKSHNWCPSFCYLIVPSSKHSPFPAHQEVWFCYICVHWVSCCLLATNPLLQYHTVKRSTKEAEQFDLKTNEPSSSLPIFTNIICWRHIYPGSGFSLLPAWYMPPYHIYLWLSVSAFSGKTAQNSVFRDCVNFVCV